MTKVKQNATTLLLVLVLLTGVGLIAYPTLSDWWNRQNQTRAVMNYSQSVAGMENAEYKEILESAEAYNTRLSYLGFFWSMNDSQRAAYEAELNIGENGIMGYIEIPKIDVTLPIYHGTNEAVLQTAIGHLEGSSLPVGGPSTHCVVSGHRGLPSARLFTDLDKLSEGDTWTITVLNRTLTYEVDQIRIVEPTDRSALRIEKGKDYCTLITCTPYGVNTHRLLVRGHRIRNTHAAEVVPDALQISKSVVGLYTGIPLFLILGFTVIFVSRRRRKRRRRRNQNRNRQRLTIENTSNR